MSVDHLPSRLRAVRTGEAQRTVGAEVPVSGVGLHSGARCTARIAPADVDAGVAFVVSGERVPLRPDAVVDTRRCTTVGEREARVATVEHLLAALHGILIDNALIYVEGPELPALDGSSREWVVALEAAGIVEQDGEALGVTPVATSAVVNGRSCLAVEPSDRLKLTCVIHYEHPLLGTQAGTFAISPSSFARELAGARTYGFYPEVAALVERGLALGGNLENALVIFEDHYSGELRYADECLRHKALDLLGDLYTGGRRFLGNVSAFMPGHSLNNDLIRLLHGLAPRQSDAEQDPKAGASEALAASNKR